MPKAIKVRPDNLWYIVNYGNKMNMDLTDIKDYYFGLEEQERFEFYVMTDGSLEMNNVTFTTMYASDMRRSWKFLKPEQDYEFVEIERI